MKRFFVGSSREQPAATGRIISWDEILGLDPVGALVRDWKSAWHSSFWMVEPPSGPSGRDVTASAGEREELPVGFYARIAPTAVFCFGQNRSNIYINSWN